MCGLLPSETVLDREGPSGIASTSDKARSPDRQDNGGQFGIILTVAVDHRRINSRTLIDRIDWQIIEGLVLITTVNSISQRTFNPLVEGSSPSTVTYARKPQHDSQRCTMSRRTARLRPAFESLEQMLMLSGVPGPGEHAPSVLVASEWQSSGPITLSGTAKGPWRTGRAATAPVHFSATGSVSPLGHISLKGSLLSVDYSYEAPAGKLTVTTRHGKVFVNLTYLYQLGTAFHQLYSYEITGGTRKWAGASGSGHALFTTFVSSRSQFHGSLRIDWDNGV
jgi:hypothetical protein